MKGAKVARLRRALVERLGVARGAASSRALFRSMQEWLRENAHAFGAKAWAENELGWLTSIDIDVFPMTKTLEELGSDVLRVASMSPKSVDAFAMLVSGVMREAVSHDAGVRCPSCGQAELKVHVESGTRRFILACERCPWGQDVEGLPVAGSGAMWLVNQVEYDEYLHLVGRSPPA